MLPNQPEGMKQLETTQRWRSNNRGIRPERTMRCKPTLIWHRNKKCWSSSGKRLSSRHHLHIILASFVQISKTLPMHFYFITIFCCKITGYILHLASAAIYILKALWGQLNHALNELGHCSHLFNIGLFEWGGLTWNSSGTKIVSQHFQATNLNSANKYNNLLNFKKFKTTRK